MTSIHRHRRALIAIALTIGVCILFATLASPYGHVDAAYLLPVFLCGLIVLVTIYRRITLHLYAIAPELFASDINFRGPPTF
jgi:hypothetical protein